MTNDKAPFQVVLIDIKKAAKEDIQCVKKPLTDQLKYVAISYRWGELEETIIDTGVGYLASITSFALHDFYHLCAAMTKEPTMVSMDYVWVDTICVNQSDHDERKATIYHMTEIYEQASWILAVPDLHAWHLITMHFDVMGFIQKHKSYVYHLVHGNTEQLDKMDQDFLDKIGVPQDQKLRLLLTKHTNGFTKGFMQYQDNHMHYNDNYIYGHLYDIHSASATQTIPEYDVAKVNDDIRSLHECRATACPLICIFVKPYQHRHRNEWHRAIFDRSIEIRQAMRFLTNLVVDWSSRVWVISEFHISKKKNNLQFWFNQLHGDDDIAFFRFDLGDPRLNTIQHTKPDYYDHGDDFGASHPAYLTFYKTLINQLNRQTFFEMMLKSKASKNEDRFYAIFPLFPEYKPWLQTKEWVNISSMVSVKLKLYQLMTNEHKNLLLYMSGYAGSTYALPTFATSMVGFLDQDNHELFTSKASPVNDITLSYDTYSIRLKPSSYSISRNAICTHDAAARTLAHLFKTSPWHGRVDVVFVWSSHDVCLLGSVDENIWILGREYLVDCVSDVECVNNMPDHFPGFNVY